MEIIKLDKDWNLASEKKIFHKPEYKKFLDEAFKSKTLYYAAKDNNEIKSVFPFVYIKHLLLGKKLISTAFLEYGGPCGDEKYVKDILDQVKKEFNDIDYIEIRQGVEKYDALLSKLAIKSECYKRFVLPLYDEETTFKKIDKAKRKTIKKAERHGVITREITTQEIPKLYHLYCKNMQSFGSPPYPRSYFKSFYKNIVANKLGKCFGAYYNNKLIAALLGFTYNNQIHVVIAISDPKYYQLRPNDAVHWAFIGWGSRNYYTLFDFGRVREGSGQFTYKKRWGSILKDLNHYYILVKSKELPKIDPTNKKYKLFIKLWQKLPLFITKIFGPWLREGLGI